MHMQHMHISIIMLAMTANFFMVPISFLFITYSFDWLDDTTIHLLCQ